MKNLRQLKDKIKNLAANTGVNPQILLRNYMTERLLERISISEYNEKFILKGGMLVASLIGSTMRSTMDIDTTIKSYPLTKESIKNIFEELILINLKDGISFKVKNIDKIRQEDEYQGYRVTISAHMEGAKIPIMMDVTTGDKITPSEIDYKYKLLLEDRSIAIKTYNIETVIAEKYETIISRGAANTRMRDFYDIYILLKTKNQEIDINNLKNAIYATAEKRQSLELLNNSSLILKEVFSSEHLIKHWESYQKQYEYAENVLWEEIKEGIIELSNNTH